MPDISTPVESTSRANISLLYTPSLAAELLEVPKTALKPDMLGATIQGWVCNANTGGGRKGVWLLFINSKSGYERRLGTRRSWSLTVQTA
jgi:DNA mismatch repair protein MLH1